MPGDKKLFIDLFAGCGGLSLGLLQAGWEGLFAIEKSPLAFSTYKHNLIDKKKFKYSWPEWLPIEAMTCSTLLENYESELKALKGEVELIVGGPPCQGFSTAGKRNPADPRNKLTEEYLALVAMVKPKFIVIENVAGFNSKFKKHNQDEITIPADIPYAELVKARLKILGYEVSSGLVNCSWFGVPQARVRYLMICERIDDENLIKNDEAYKSKVTMLMETQIGFLKRKNLPTDKAISVKDALSDLEIANKKLVPCEDLGSAKFLQAAYVEPEKLTQYQLLMKKGLAKNSAPSSRRLPRHQEKTVEYFKLLHQICASGKRLSKKVREEMGKKKHSLTLLNPNLPSPTVTTLPDDILHYSEPRILTVRENARLQSFPDWFEFQGKYTTGGINRKNECPRYTQVGNAVPPLLAEAIGSLLNELLSNKVSKDLCCTNTTKLPVLNAQ